MLHCVVVALSAGFTGLRAPSHSPHVHGRLATRPILHQRAAAAVGVPAVGDVQATEAAECRASAMAAQSKESELVADARVGMKAAFLHHDEAACGSQGLRVHRHIKGEPLAPAAQLLGDNRGPIQAPSISFGSDTRAVEVNRSPRRALWPVMLADGSDEVPDSLLNDLAYRLVRLVSYHFPLLVAIFLQLLMLLLPDAGLEKNAFPVLFCAILWPELLTEIKLETETGHGTVWDRRRRVFVLTVLTLYWIGLLAKDLLSYNITPN